MNLPFESDEVAPGDVLRTRARTAFLAAAYGDALGWPNETRGKSSAKMIREKPSLNLAAWKRRDGTLYSSHVENVPAGTYSDDTQLIACVARSYLVAGDAWWERFTTVELPFWLLYQRGGGGATLRAAKSWSDKRQPWAAAEKYFDAGGNGAAMRVLPHVVIHVRSQAFRSLKNSVVLDALSTHGHPRAVVGALIFAFSLWSLMRRTRSLGFGQIIDDAISNETTWAEFPFRDTRLSESIASRGWIIPTNYESRWSETVSEVRNLLSIARDAIAEGAAFNDRPTLARLGALGETRGSGTVSACAALFLASRYATDPSQGVIEATFAAGADTDTLGSMTSTLLACLGEGEQLAYRAKGVQDHDFLLSLGTALSEADHNRVLTEEAGIVTSASAKRWQKSLMSQKPGECIQLLDGRSGVVSSLDCRHEHNLLIAEALVTVEDGQTLRFKKIERVSEKKQPTIFEESISGKPAQAKLENARVDFGSYAFAPEIVLRCRDLDVTVSFYCHLLGLRLYEDKRPRQNHVRVEGPFTFALANSSAEIKAQFAVELRLRVRGIENLALLLKSKNIEMETASKDLGFGTAVIVRDPDGRSVVLISAR